MSLLRSYAPRPWVLAFAGLLFAGAGVWGVVTMTKKDPNALPNELSAESLKAAAADGNRRELMSRVRDAFQSEDLTDEQRQKLRQNMREAFRAQNRERLNEYFAAKEAERQLILDRHIDQMQARRREFEQRRQEWQRNREQRSADGRGPGGRGPWGDGNRTPPTREQRKSRSEQRDADEMARNMAYFSALRKRAEERGIDMPFGRGGFGRRGGPGGRG